MTDLVFELPNKSTPGYLKRQRKALVFYKALTGDPEPETVDEIVEFLVDFVTEPAEIEEAKEALRDASEDQFQLLFNAVLGRTDTEGNPTKPPPKKKRAT